MRSGFRAGDDCRVLFRLSEGESKKLAEAAAFWATGRRQPKSDDSLAEQFAAFGAPSDLVDQVRETATDEETFEIHEDCADAVAAFLCLATQWRVVAGFGAVVYQGFDYAAIPAVLSMLGIKRPSERTVVFHDLRVMESGALAVLNRRDESDNG